MKRTFGLVLGLVLAIGCGASSSPRAMHVASAADTTPRPQQFAAALEEALNLYEADVREAARAWYPSYTEAYGTAQALLEPDFDVYLERTLSPRGLSLSDLNAYAEEHPEFVDRQNEAFTARMADLRPTGYAIMGRIDPDRAEPSPRIAEPPAETTQDVAIASRP